MDDSWLIVTGMYIIHFSVPLLFPSVRIYIQLLMFSSVLLQSRTLID